MRAHACFVIYLCMYFHVFRCVHYSINGLLNSITSVLNKTCCEPHLPASVLLAVKHKLINYC